MIVVADTSPMNYLIQIDQVELLPQLYGRLVLPGAVLSELRADGAPMKVLLWSSHLPAWVDVKRAPDPTLTALSGLDLGEREALSIAIELHADLLLLDERKGTGVAKTLGSLVTGTLGVLRDAHIAGFVDGLSAYRRLQSDTNLTHTPQLSALFEASLRGKPSITRAIESATGFMEAIIETHRPSCYPKAHGKTDHSHDSGRLGLQG